MTNAEIITALRYCPSHGCRRCVAVDANGVCTLHGVVGIMNSAADALEAAEQRIADLETALSACRARKEQLSKEGEWIHGREIGKEWLYDHWITYFEDWRCSNCGVVFEQESKPKYHYCPNCGARMKTVTDCHALNER